MSDFGGSIFQYSILVIAIFGAVTDLIWGKIFNWFNALVMVLGLLFAAQTAGWLGLGQSFLGIVAGFVLLGWMFALRILGGGDVKFLMALGAWVGLRSTLEIAVLSILIGGVFSLLILIFTGRLLNFLKRMQIFFLSLVIQELEFQKPKVDRSLTMPFGVSISLAAVGVVFFHPFAVLGVQLWP